MISDSDSPSPVETPVAPPEPEPEPVPNCRLCVCVTLVLCLRTKLVYLTSHIPCGPLTLTDTISTSPSDERSRLCPQSEAAKWLLHLTTSASGRSSFKQNKAV